MISGWSWVIFSTSDSIKIHCDHQFQSDLNHPPSKPFLWPNVEQAYLLNSWYIISCVNLPLLYSSNSRNSLSSLFMSFRTISRRMSWSSPRVLQSFCNWLMQTFAEVCEKEQCRMFGVRGWKQTKRCLQNAITKFALTYMTRETACHSFIFKQAVNSNYSDTT